MNSREAACFERTLRFSKINNGIFREKKICIILFESIFMDKLSASMKVLLVEPYNRLQGHYAFHAPSLGVWRIYGFLTLRP
jgi:hypothetical protein